MLTFAADFWPLFWAIWGGAAALTIVVSLLIATVPNPFARGHRRQLPPALPHPATDAPASAGADGHLRAAA